jgi:cytochrome c biogenesis protein
MPPDKDAYPGSGVMARPEQAAGEVERAAMQRDPVDLVWRFLSNTKVAVILIFLTMLAAFLGAVFIQAPGWALDNPQGYASWLDRVRPRYGALTDLYSALGLFNVYNSLWFRGLTSLLILSTIVCTLNRIPGIWRSVFRVKVVMGENFYRHSANRASIPAPLAAEEVAGLLRKQRYRVSIQRVGENTYLYADRNRWAKLGTILTHLSIILFLAGAVTGALLGFSDDEAVIGEGSTYTVGHGYDFKVRLNDFSEEWYPEGMPKDYRSDLSIIEGGREVLRKTIRVNDPLVYKGVKFSQSFYGVAPALEVRDSNGRVLFSDILPMSPSTLKGYLVGLLTFGPDTTVVVGRPEKVSGAAAVHLEAQVYSGGKLLQQGVLRQGQPQQMGNLRLEFLGDREYTGLRVSKDPGTSLIWVASGLMLLGICTSFYFPRRRLWVRVAPQETALAAFADRMVPIKQELAKIVRALSPEERQADRKHKRRR